MKRCYLLAQLALGFGASALHAQQHGQIHGMVSRPIPMSREVLERRLAMMGMTQLHTIRTDSADFRVSGMRDSTTVEWTVNRFTGQVVDVRARRRPVMPPSATVSMRRHFINLSRDNVGQLGTGYLRPLPE